MSRVAVAVKRLAHGADLPLPRMMSDEAAGSDLMAAVDAPLTIAPGAFAAVPTGIAIALPKGYEAQVRPRSGLAAKHGVTVLNSPGTVDSDYRGEIKVLLINHGPVPFVVERGQRIAQLVVAPVSFVSWIESDNLESSARGENGFGSTGLEGKTR